MYEIVQVELQEKNGLSSRYRLLSW